MPIPKNGRIAIVEDSIDEARPIFEVLSKNELPYVFYEGTNPNFLPEANSRLNDIRILLLDLNLINKGKPSVKDVKSTLFGVLRRIISEVNYPYSVIVWSKQEGDYIDCLKELFQNELKDRQPVSIHPFLKSDFFELDGTVKENDINLTEKINQILEEEHGHNKLLEWENMVHVKTDEILQKLFKKSKEENEWEDSIIYDNNELSFELIFDLLERGGNNNYKGITEKLKQSFTKTQTEVLGKIIGKDQNQVLVQCIIDDQNFQNRKFELGLFSAVTNCDVGVFVKIININSPGFRSIKIVEIEDDIAEKFIDKNPPDFTKYTKPEK